MHAGAAGCLSRRLLRRCVQVRADVCYTGDSTSSNVAQCHLKCTSTSRATCGLRLTLRASPLCAGRAAPGGLCDGELHGRQQGEMTLLRSCYPPSDFAVVFALVRCIQVTYDAAQQQYVELPVILHLYVAATPMRPHSVGCCALLCGMHSIYEHNRQVD